MQNVISPTAKTDPFHLESQCSHESKTRPRRVRRVEFFDAVLSLTNYWISNQQSIAPSARQSFDTWLASLSRAMQSDRSVPENGLHLLAANDVELQEMARVAAVLSAANSESDTNSVRFRYRFVEVVKVARSLGLFGDLLRSSKDGSLNRECRCAFARVLKRYNHIVLNGSIRMSLVGAGHGRRYVFERLNGGS
jgi:hypothetical protein